MHLSRCHTPQLPRVRSRLCNAPQRFRIGMSAFIAPPALWIRYDLLTTVGSMLAAIVVAAGALYFVGRDPKRIANILLGGVFAGSGVAIMHYIGMDAMRMRAIIKWDMSIVGISVLIAIAAAI